MVIIMDAALLKATARSRDAQEKREAERRRALLVLILRHLADHGYVDSLDRLSTECNLCLDKHDAADNISLLQILQDYEEAHEQRYGRRPKLVKQLEVRVTNVTAGQHHHRGGLAVLCMWAYAGICNHPHLQPA